MKKQILFLALVGLLGNLAMVFVANAGVEPYSRVSGRVVSWDKKTVTVLSKTGHHINVPRQAFGKAQLKKGQRVLNLTYKWRDLQGFKKTRARRPASASKGRKLASDENPLFVAVYKDDYVAFHKYIEQKSLINKASSIYGRTPLIEAARQGNHNFVKWLLVAGADIHSKDKFGETALHKAFLFGYSQVVNLLLAAFADAYEINTEEVKALAMQGWYAKKNKNPNQDKPAVAPAQNFEASPPRHGKYAKFQNHWLTQEMAKDVAFRPLPDKSCRNPQFVSCRDDMFQPLGIRLTGSAVCDSKTCKFNHAHANINSMCVGWTVCRVRCDGSLESSKMQRVLACGPTSATRSAGIVRLPQDSSMSQISCPAALACARQGLSSASARRLPDSIAW